MLMRNSVMRLRVAAILSIINLVTASILPACATTADNWQEHALKGFALMHRNGQPEEAYECYRQARRMLVASSTDPVALDLELCMAAALIASARYSEASKLLQSIKPRILKANSGTLLEARYYRQCVDLATAEKDAPNIIVAQEHATALVAENLGADSPDALQMRIGLIANYLLYDPVYSWKRALEECEYCEKLLAVRGNYQELTPIRAQFEKTIDILARKSAEGMQKEPDHGLSLVKSFAAWRPNDPRQINLWASFAKQSSLSQADSSLAKSELLKLLRRHTWPTEVDLMSNVVPLVISNSVPSVFSVSPEWPANVSKETIADVDKCYSFALHIVPKQNRSSSDLYVQTTSLKAAALASTLQDLEQADALLGKLQFSRTHFKDMTGLLCVLQARRALARAYARKGEPDKIRDQFSKIYKLINAQTPVAIRAQEIARWEWLEHEYLSHIGTMRQMDQSKVVQSK
jgi:tetratricopeptide (TPR) repeat protein